MRRCFLFLAMCFLISNCAKKTQTIEDNIKTIYVPKTDTLIIEKITHDTVIIVKEIESAIEMYKPGNINFDFDNYTLKNVSIDALGMLAKEMYRHGTMNVKIEGHACRIGSEEYNLALGEHRALAAKHYLMKYGINPERIETISYGELKPIGGPIEDDRRDEFTIWIE